MERIAVLIPCYNEAVTIAQVVADFQRVLPKAKLVVYDNNSTDATAEEAARTGVEVRREYRQGKGSVLRTMFREIDADLYVLVDGDATYPAEEVHKLIAPVAAGRADMSVGMRLEHYGDGSFRFLHRFGNRLIRGLINTLFGTRMEDVLSGYRCFNRRFVKSLPILSDGFEVETELTLQALDKGFGVVEVPIHYRPRPAGSASKLSTFRDGLLILRTIFDIYKDYRPLRFFSGIGLLSLATGIVLGSVPVGEYLHTGLVTHASTAVLATGLVLVSGLCFATGLILDAVNRRYREQYQMLRDFVIDRRPSARPYPAKLDARGEAPARRHGTAAP